MRTIVHEPDVMKTTFFEMYPCYFADLGLVDDAHVDSDGNGEEVMGRDDEEGDDMADESILSSDVFQQRLGEKREWLRWVEDDQDDSGNGR